MNWFFLIIAALIPIFASPLIGGIPADPAQRVVYIEQYLYFLLAFATWNAALTAATYFLRKDLKELSIRAVIAFLPLLLCLLLALSSLQLFKFHFYPGQFYLLIISLSIQSGSVVLFKRNRSFPAIVILGLNSLLVGYMTFTFGGLNFNWQALVFLVGLSAQIMSLRLSLLFSGKCPTLLRHNELSPAQMAINKAPSPLKIRIYLLALLSGFLSIALLVLFGHLPLHYFVIYLLLPLIVRLANKVRTAGIHHQSIDAQTGQILMAYMLLVALATLYTH